MSQPGSIGAIMSEATYRLKESMRTNPPDEKAALAAQSAACSLVAISNMLLVLCEDARFGMLVANLRDYKVEVPPSDALTQEPES